MTPVRGGRDGGSARIGSWSTFVIVLPLFFLCGCASTGGSGLSWLGGRGVDDPWRLPTDAYPTQRLFRVQYESPQRDASFKLTLYLLGQSEYRMLAADTLGRKLWSLDVDPAGQAVWIDHRQKSFCRLGAAEHLSFTPLARLPLISLPRLLLGRLPADPEAALDRQQGWLTYLDARGQRWSGRLDDDQQVEWWSLEDRGEKVAWWLREEAAAGVFTHRRSRQQLRWREVVRETLSERPAGLEIPYPFREVVCDAELDGAGGDNLGR